MSQDRYQETRNRLYDILRRKGIIFTAGLLIGIIARMSLTDYALYKEIETRHKDLV